MACGCRSIHEGSGGVSFSYEILGVLCPSCEAEIAQAEFADWFDSLPAAEQVSMEVGWRWSAAVHRMPYRRPGSPSANPPF